jgi:ATP-dependent helicase/nuclease subunit A
MDVHIHKDAQAIEILLTSLVDKCLLTPDEAASIDRNAIEIFMNAPLAERMRAAVKLYREVPFVMDTDDFNEQGEKTLVHGIIDCFFEERGGIVLVDYKSDKIYGEPEKWAEKHRLQLEIYKKAAAEATGLNVIEICLYSFDLGRVIVL